MQELTKSFVAVDKNGQQHALDLWTETVNIVTAVQNVTISTGRTTFKTRDGTYVNHVGPGKYKIV